MQLESDCPPLPHYIQLRGQKVLGSADLPPDHVSLSTETNALR